MDRREISKGFGDTLARAFELAVTPLIFGFLGYLLDGALGTRPVVAIVLGLLAVIGTMVRMYYGYVADMEAHQAKSPWAARPERPA